MLIHVTSRRGRVEKGREASRAERANGLPAIRFRKIVKLFSGVEGFGGERGRKEERKGSQIDSRLLSPGLRLRSFCSF
ncbi:hypothetical protein B296_00010704 [Ensete ventricosum]|uniref:Uncharacterized protein n=1 Tax=Ensete ventricosum TaxID=4639 RepID=A0A427AI31_ENSVE|nr:hypothetical protein B296_00010704 [Ensete ventricosum]